MTSLALKTALIFARKSCPDLTKKIRYIIDELDNLNINWQIDRETLDTHALDIDSSQHDKPDFMICIGGDGSMLHAAQHAISNQIPLLGINHGRIGFLTEQVGADHTKLSNILPDDFIVEPRLILETWVKRDGHLVFQGYCLNETCLTRQPHQHVLEISLKLDQKEVCQFHGDGVIIATPTGSTAYALSAGGPIISPDIQAISIVPICPHKLSSRPIIINQSTEIELTITHFHSHNASLVFDSQPPKEFAKDEQLIIKASKKVIQLIHPNSYSHFQKLSQKLLWEQRDNA